MLIRSSSQSKFFSESRYCKGTKPHSGWPACLKAIMASFGPAFNNGKPASSVRVEAGHKTFWAVRFVHAEYDRLVLHMAGIGVQMHLKLSLE